MKSVPSRILALPAALALLVACGGGDVVLVGTNESALRTGDEDPSRIQVLLTLKEIHAHVVGKKQKDSHHDDGDGDRLEWKTKNGKWMTATLSHPRTIDLLSIGKRKVVLADLDLPEGKITQLRLFLDESGRNEVVLPDGTACPLRIPSSNQTGIKIAKPFKILKDEDEEVRVLLDFNLKESVKKEGACSYKLDPVFKVRVER